MSAFKTFAGCSLALFLPVVTHGAPTLPVIPTAGFKVTAFGAVGDGTTDNTTAIQNAIRAAQTAGGGTVELTAAAAPYLCGPITVGNNINLQIDLGATLQMLPFGAGTNAPGTYPLSGTAYVNFLSITGNNVALTGGGTIEGNGAAWWAAFNANNAIPHRPYMIRFNNSNFVLIKDLTLKNSPMFHVAFGATNNVTIDNLTIATTPNSVNTDGIDPAGQHYLIKNCTVSTGDDNICLKPQSSPCGDITVVNCTFGTGHGVSVGGQTNSGLDGFAVINCTFIGTTNGLRLKADPTEGGLVQNVTYSNITMTDVQFPIVFYSYYDQVGNPGAIGGTNWATVDRAASWNATPPNPAYLAYATKTMPTWRNLTINNLTATRTAGGLDGFSVIWGLPNLPIANVTLNNVRLSGYSGAAIFNAQNVLLTGGTSLPGLTTYNAQIVTAPAPNVTVAVGGTARLAAPVVATAGATGVIAPTVQWSFNGRALTDGPQPDGSTIAGAATSSLTVANAQPGDTGFYTATATAAFDTFGAGLIPGGARSSLITNPAALTVGDAAAVGRLINLSARASIGAGANNLVAGFVVGGAGTDGSVKKILLRAIGPGLAALGVPGVLADPELTVANANTGAIVAANDNWGGDANVATVAAQVGAFPLANPAGLDAALITSLPSGGYTANLSGPGATTGVALLEVYDAAATSPATAPRLINVSARAPVTAGAGALIAGFVINGSAAKTVLVRAIGPALTQFGVPGALADPILQLYAAGSNGLIATNDNWSGDPAVVAAAGRVGAFALDPASRDAALLVTLPPGGYTANLTGSGGGTGVALLEVYEVP
jgi:hypothetical protein